MIKDLRFKNINNSGGQILLIILLVMTVGLAIGLSVIQRSLTDVSTAAKQEQSSRALSAAEAGIESALSGIPTGPVSFSDNNSAATVSDSGLQPAPTMPLEYPPLTREDIAQFWLADPNPALALPAFYTGSTLALYWGVPGVPDSEKPAVEFSVTYQDGSSVYRKLQYFYDPVTVRRTNNRFRDPAESAGYGCSGNYTIAGSNTTFLCRALISGLPVSPNKLILARARFLYSVNAQPLLLAPLSGGSLPPQARIYTSVGSAGDTQRRVQLFKLDQVVPNYFDYAIFSAGDIAK